MEVPTGRCVLSTYKDDVLGTSAIENKHLITPCTHKKADNRLLLLASHFGCCGMSKVIIKTVDTDVVVIPLGH